jgi:hypothetical protein
VAQTSRITARVESDLTSALDLVTATSELDSNTQINLESGTGLGAADMQWSDTRTLAASATEDLDLAGSLTGPLGTTLTFARIKAVLVKALAANTNDVNVTRPASNGAPLFLAASDGLAVKPGGLFLWVAPNAAGAAVTAATGDLLTLTNSSSGTPVTYSIIVIGASA